MMVLLLVLLMWAYLGEVMDEQRDSATSTVTILPLKAEANILHTVLNAALLVLWIIAVVIGRACSRAAAPPLARWVRIYLHGRWLGRRDFRIHS